MAVAVAGHTTTSSTTNANSYTLSSYTPATGTNRILVVRVHGLGSNDTGTYGVSSVTFGGVALTEAVTLRHTGASRTYRTSIYYLINPSSSAGNIVVTFSQTVQGCIIAADTLTGAAQTSPIAETNTDIVSPEAVLTIADLAAGS